MSDFVSDLVIAIGTIIVLFLIYLWAHRELKKFIKPKKEK